MRRFLIAALLLAAATPAFAAPPALRLDGTASAALRSAEPQPLAIALPVPMRRVPGEGMGEAPRSAITTQRTTDRAE